MVKENRLSSVLLAPSHQESLEKVDVWWRWVLRHKRQVFHTVLCFGPQTSLPSAMLVCIEVNVNDRPMMHRQSFCGTGKWFTRDHFECPSGWWLVSSWSNARPSPSMLSQQKKHNGEPERLGDTPRHHPHHARCYWPVYFRLQPPCFLGPSRQLFCRVTASLHIM